MEPPKISSLMETAWEGDGLSFGSSNVEILPSKSTGWYIAELSDAAPSRYICTQNKLERHRNVKLATCIENTIHMENTENSLKVSRLRPTRTTKTH